MSRNNLCNSAPARDNVSTGHHNNIKMPTHTFISDPSLLRKDSRSRSIVISAINSHTAKHKHAKRRRTDLQPRQHGHGLKHFCSCKLDRPCHIHLRSNVTDVPAGIKFRHSQYLQETYGGNDENLINTLFSYCKSRKEPSPIMNNELINRSSL